MANIKAPFGVDDKVFFRHDSVKNYTWVLGQVRAVDFHHGGFVATIKYKGLTLGPKIVADDIKSPEGPSDGWAAELEALNTVAPEPTNDDDDDDDDDDQQPAGPTNEEKVAEMIGDMAKSTGKEVTHALREKLESIEGKLASVCTHTDSIPAMMEMLQTVVKALVIQGRILDSIRFCQDELQLDEFDKLFGPNTPATEPRTQLATQLFASPPLQQGSASGISSISSDDSNASLLAPIPGINCSPDVNAGTIMKLPGSALSLRETQSNVLESFNVFTIAIQQVEEDGAWTVRYHSRDEMMTTLFGLVYPNHDELCDPSFVNFGIALDSFVFGRYPGGPEKACHYSYTHQYFALPLTAPSEHGVLGSWAPHPSVVKWTVEVVGTADEWPDHTTNTLAALMRTIMAPVQTAVALSDQCKRYNHLLKQVEYDRKAKGRYLLAYGEPKYDQSVREPDFMDGDSSDLDDDEEADLKAFEAFDEQSVSPDVRREQGYNEELGLALHQVSSLIDWTRMEGVELIRYIADANNNGNKKGKYASRGWKCVSLKKSFIAEMVKISGGDFPTAESCRIIGHFGVIDNESATNTKLQTRLNELFFPVDKDGRQHVPWLKFFTWNPLRLFPGSIDEAHKKLFKSDLCITDDDVFRFCPQQGILYAETDGLALAKMSFASIRAADDNTVKVITYYRFLKQPWMERKDGDSAAETAHKLGVTKAIESTVFATIGNGPAIKKRPAPEGSGSTDDLPTIPKKAKKPKKKKGKGKAK